jgi:hypothetical protein
MGHGGLGIGQFTVTLKVWDWVEEMLGLPVAVTVKV